MSYPYEPDTGRTHYEGCWRERGHHNCAVAYAEAAEARIQELESENERLRQQMNDKQPR